MSKRILSVILALSMLIGIVSVTAFAESDYKYSRIAYFDEGGSEVYTLVPDKPITAMVKAKSATKTDELVFLLLLYKANKIIDVSIDQKVVGEAATTYSATLTMPEDVTGLELNAVLWDGFKSMNSICRASLFASGKSELLSLCVNGEEVLDKISEDGSMNFEISPTETKIPVVTCKPMDSGAKVEITNPVMFPGKSVVKVTSQDGNKTDTYTINYTAECVTDLTMIDAGANAAYIKYMKNFNKSSEVFANRAGNSIDTMDASLEGLDYITSEGGSSVGGNWGVSGSPWYKFTLERPATVMILRQAASAEFLTGEDWGWTKDTISGFNLVTSWKTLFKTRYKKDFPAGEVILPACGTDNGLVVMIDYKDYESVSENPDADLNL